MDLGLLWDYFGGQMVALDQFEATFWHMAIILVHLGVIWRSLWGGFGPLWGECGVTLG